MVSFVKLFVGWLVFFCIERVPHVSKRNVYNWVKMRTFFTVWEKFVWFSEDKFLVVEFVGFLLIVAIFSVVGRLCSFVESWRALLFAESAEKWRFFLRWFSDERFVLPLRNSTNFSRSVICVRICVMRFSLSFTGFVNLKLNVREKISFKESFLEIYLMNRLVDEFSKFFCTEKQIIEKKNGTNFLRFDILR